MKHVQAFSGHSDIEMTRRYLPGVVYHQHMPEIAVRVAVTPARRVASSPVPVPLQVHTWDGRVEIGFVSGVRQDKRAFFSADGPGATRGIS
jgi:hypothetical protein